MSYSVNSTEKQFNSNLRLMSGLLNKHLVEYGLQDYKMSTIAIW